MKKYKKSKLLSRSKTSSNIKFRFIKIAHSATFIQWLWLCMFDLPLFHPETWHLLLRIMWYNRTWWGLKVPTYLCNVECNAVQITIRPGILRSNHTQSQSYNVLVLVFCIIFGLIFFSEFFSDKPQLTSNEKVMKEFLKQNTF